PDRSVARTAGRFSDRGRRFAPGARPGRGSDRLAEHDPGGYSPDCGVAAVSAPAATYVACLTPPGSAAIATLGLYGPEAWNVVRQLFRPQSKSGASLPPEPEDGRFWFGRFGEELSDEVVLGVRRGRPVRWLELHCHGGREVLRLLQGLLEARGVRSCSWHDFERRTTTDPLRALAPAALAEAPTARTAAILLDQYQGASAALGKPSSPRCGVRMSAKRAGC